MQSAAPDAAQNPTAAAPQRIGIPRETFPGEKRVSSVPDAVEKLMLSPFLTATVGGSRLTCE